MPLEVTPPPFAASQRLPYTPAFARADLPGTHPSGASSLGAGGPVTAAASAIIPPTPGGIADPNRAIPALPEAGYTAPSIRPGSVSIQPLLGGAGGSIIGGSVHGGASVYGGMRGPPTSLSVSGYEPAMHQSHHHVHSPLSTVHSDGWSASSLPAPRRGPPPPPESMIAPKNHHHHHQQLQQQHHHHHPTDFHDRHHRQVVDFDDGKSDASYYALPKVQKPRSRSGSVSSMSDRSSPKDILPVHHRSRSISGVHRQHRSPSIPPIGHLHSPISPSPLAAAGGGGSDIPSGRSPQSPGEIEALRKVRGSPAPEEEKRQRLHSYIPSDYGTHESAHGDRPRERRHSARHENERPGLRRHNSAQHSHHTHDHNHAHVHHHGHHRHRSGSHVPPPPPSERSYAPSYRPISPTFSGDGGGGRGGALGLHLQGDAGSSGGRRRALSMQGLDRPYNIHAYQAPTVAGAGNATVYDDGASVISDSKMTFMDGSVAGRTSQYGLPKYPHQPKMDYRRFCVQRGNADVFLD
ncbi:hypothetical protein I316_07216 [Kwoniella heveanensis BCC8398]|uniref:Uncharacterized protein n=1 Tax=Kwoniella heveanensis BCC8398 TaxID=1296120 RepID=A0A1B9GJG8_9TREE|nr:hypothetical protein I316_07216 [Kwoniella heveanensis BCC8398]